jgi:hypothetical protein
MQYKIENMEDALACALALAITAPTAQKAGECFEHAQWAAWQLDEPSIKRAKARALNLVADWEREGGKNWAN